MAEDRPLLEAVRNGSKGGAPSLIRACGLCKRFQNGGAVVDVLRGLLCLVPCLLASPERSLMGQNWLSCPTADRGPRA